MSEAKVNTLIKKRGSFKAKLTYFTNFIRLLPKNELDSYQSSELLCRLNAIESLYKEFDVLQTELELLSEDTENMYVEREQFEMQYYTQVGLAKVLLATARPSLSAADDITPVGGSGCRHDFVRLPKIDLPHFDGDYQHWLEFRDTYISLIHTNNSIQPINKFHYLRAALTGSASLVIKSIDFNSNNYSIAWQLLTERYNNEKLLINNHIQALFDFEIVTKESPAQLRNMIDVTNKNLRALDTLGQPTQHWDTLIIYMMSKKLDPVSSRDWEQHKTSLDALPSLIDFTKFLSNKADLLDTLFHKKHTNHNTLKNSETYKIKNYHTTTNTKFNNNSKKITLCPMCSQNHYLFNCESFRQLDIQSRLKKASESNICMNCLRPGHTEKNCKLSHCKYCKIKHNTLLHRDTTDKVNNSVTLSINSKLTSSNDNQTITLLSTALAKVADIDGRLHTVRLLLDNGSTSNFVTEDLCGKLNLVRQNTSSTVSGINGQVSFTSERCSLNLQSYHGGYQASIICLILPQITHTLPGTYVDKQNIAIPPGLQLADPKFYVPSAIDILVGAEVFWDVLGSESISLGKNKPKLQSSKLGWLIAGCVYQSQHSQPAVCHILSHQESDQISRFWELDSVLTKNCFSTEEQTCEELFHQTTQRNERGQFVVTIPLKESPECLGDSYAMAKRRFISLERKFDRDPIFKQRYLQFMQEYLDLKHMSKNNECEQFNFNYFMPHHGVLRESSSTTKLRVVYDASASSSSGKSFNDIQMVGPTVQEDILSILLRYRQHKFVVTGDIEKMYRAILVQPSQRSLQQIVFRFDSSETLKTYTLNTVTYGTASAPYLATKCLVSLADNCLDHTVSESIRRDFYVDDYLSGGDEIESVIKLCKGVVNVLESANFNLRKWQSNSLDILKSVTNIKNQSDKTLNLSDASSSKTLGLYWDCKLDHLFYSVELKGSTFKVTKRNILSVVSQVFDPLGLVGPCIVPFKIILQQLWILKCDWDEDVPVEISKQFLECLKLLPALNELRVPRWVSFDDPSIIELHIFTDASECAYGACVYVRTVAVNGTVCVRLLTSKNKVAPIKPTTIPRLELCGALLGSRLYLKVRKSLTLHFHKCYFWCDSTIVLSWLSITPNRLEQFVRNRVSEIQEATTGQTWSYVPSKCNPADLASRGVKADCISGSSLWWSGPDFLKQPYIQFPPSPNPQSQSSPEISLNTIDNNTLQDNNLILKLIHNSSSFTKIIRIVAYIQRFTKNCRKQNNMKSSYLTYSELHTSQQLILQISQQEMFPEEYTCLKNNQILHKKNRLISLSPFIDTEHLIRVGGRLKNSHYEYNIKHPILLCSKHHVTKLIFEAEHKKLLHVGPQTLLAHIRLSYWPLGGRNLAKGIVRNCVRCTRCKGQSIQVTMGNLPSDRTHLEFPFLNTGLDYAGPVLIADRKGRGCKLSKSYICVFVCLAVRAIHLELVSDLTKEAFLAAFSRFISRRGKPQRVYSDNGTTFVGAFNELSQLLRVSSNTIESNIASQGIDFKFIPAYTPHFGGIWEAAVKSTKHLLHRVVGLTHLTYEELSTCLVQIEAVLNSRPLTPLSTDPSDLSYLSPSHFLIGRSFTSFPRPDFMDSNMQRLQRYDRIEKLRQHFWHRFSHEYVSLLQQRTKWQTDGQEIKLGAMVLVKDLNLPPLQWLLGRVIAVKPGSDGRNRVADILTKKGTIMRAYNNICPLPVPSSSS